MKQLFTAIALVCAATTLHGQGQFQFVNRETTSDLDTRVYSADPDNPTLFKTGNTVSQLPEGTQTYNGVPLSGTGFTVELWASTNNAPASSLNPVPAALGGRNAFRTGVAAGIMNSGVIATIPGVPQGATATVQYRIWDNRGGTITSWAAALADPAAPKGVSPIFTVSDLGQNINFPPVPAPVNLRSFNIPGLVIVPEPSTIALGFIAITAVLLRRRR